VLPSLWQTSSAPECQSGGRPEGRFGQPNLGTGHTYLRDAAEAVEGMARPNLVYATELRGSSKVYRSDHSAPLWSINRDGAVATSVELPAGTTSADVDKSLVIRQPILADNGSPVTVTAVNRSLSSSVRHQAA